MTEEITFTVADYVGEIMLNRPQKHNAMTPKMAAELQAICAAIDRDDTVRVVMLKGAGERAFCSGSDLNSLAEYPSAWAFFRTSARRFSGRPVRYAGSTYSGSLLNAAAITRARSAGVAACERQRA